MAAARYDGSGSRGWIYTSPDLGTSWTRTSAPSNHWSSVASSADGSKLVAVAQYDIYHEGDPAPIYTSPDSGASWTQTSAPNKYWTSVASSADGSKLVAVALVNSIYTSADSGATWVQTSAPSNYWWSVASSADGTKLVAAGSFVYDLRGWKAGYHRLWARQEGGFHPRELTRFSSVEGLREIASWQIASLFVTDSLARRSQSAAERTPGLQTSLGRVHHPPTRHDEHEERQHRDPPTGPP